MHHLIIGLTSSGKSTLAKSIVTGLRKRGKKTIVLDPIKDSSWQADFITDDIQEFLDIVKRSESCYLFCDESGDYMNQYQKETHFLATRARHLGHTCFFICQRATMVAPNVRTNCTNLYCFKTSFTDSKLLADDFACNELYDSINLKKGEYIFVNTYGGSKRQRIF